MITSLFNTVLSIPLINALIFLYNIVPIHNIGIAIILLTIIIKLILYPLSKKAIRSQKALNELQPEIKAIQQKYKNDKEKQSQELLAIYKKYQINPLSGCLPILIQLPILIALYQVFLSALDAKNLTNLYSFVARPEIINSMFLGIGLVHPSWVLGVITGIAQFYYSKLTMAKVNNKDGQADRMDMAKIMSQQMLYVMPLLTFFFATQFPAGLALYWLTMTLFGIGEQMIVKSKTYGKDDKQPKSIHGGN